MAQDWEYIPESEVPGHTLQQTEDPSVITETPAPLTGRKVLNFGKPPTPAQPPTPFLTPGSAPVLGGPQGQIQPSLSRPSGFAPLEMVKRGFLPTLGGAAGYAAGAATRVPGAAQVGMGLGSAGMTYVNQLLGWEDPSGLSIALSTLPAALPAGMRLAKEMPGAAGGLQEANALRATELIKGVAPEVPSQVLYGKLPKGLRLPLTNLGQAAASVAQQEAKLAQGLRSPQVARLVEAANDLVASVGTGAPEDVFRANRTRFGEYVRKAVRGSSEEERAAKQIYAGMQRDLEAATAGGRSPYAMALSEAQEAFERELAGAKLEKVFFGKPKQMRGLPKGWKSMGTPVLGRPTFQTADQAIKAIIGDKELNKWLPANEIADIVDTLAILSKTPPVQRQAGTAGVGGISFGVRHLVGAALGGAVGPFLPDAGPIGGLVYGPVGAVIATEFIDRGLMTPAGRALIRGMAQNGATADQIIGFIGQVGLAATKAGLSRPEPRQVGEMTPPTPVTPIRGGPGPGPEATWSFSFPPDLVKHTLSLPQFRYTKGQAGSLRPEDEAAFLAQLQWAAHQRRRSAAPR